MEIVAGAPFPSKPDKIDLVMSTRRWLYYDPERPDLIEAAARYITLLSKSHANVYTGVRLYTKAAKLQNSRSEEYTKPSRVIFIDDAPAAPELPYSLCVRTSEHSRHAYYKCDRSVTKDDIRRAAAALGGDPSGADLTQLVRVPGTFNTKNNERFAVAVESTSGAPYTLNELRTRWPAVAPKARAADVTSVHWPEVETHLGNINALLSCGRSQLIKPETQTGRILAGEMLALPSARYGRLDDSTSINACAAALGFYLRGYPDDEIAAIIFHLYSEWGTTARKGTAWVRGDAHRILAYCHTQHPNVKQSPTRYGKLIAAEPIADVPAATRARLDRPTRLDPAMLFARYQAEPALCELKRKARAAQLEISTATLDRLEDSLETIGLIEIHAKPGMPGRVVIQGGVINIPPAEVLSPSVTAQVPESQHMRAETGQTADRAPQCIGGTHPPPGPQPRAAGTPGLTLGDPARITISIVTPKHARASDAIYEAIVAIDTQPPIDVLDRKTGEVRQIKLRVNKQRVDRYLQEQHNIYVLPEVLDELYPEQLERRTRERKIAALADLNPTGLRAQLRLAEHMADKHKALDEPVARWWAFYRDMARKELMSRPADPERPKGGRKNCEALPDMRAAGGRRQAELWDAAEDAIEAQRVERRGRPASTRVARGACVPPNPAPAGAPPAGGPSDAPRDIVARLNALKAQRESLAALQ
jgi:hypothetical protein